MADVTHTGPGGATILYEERGSHHEENVALSNHYWSEVVSVDTDPGPFVDGELLCGEKKLTSAVLRGEAGGIEQILVTTTGARTPALGFHFFQVRLSQAVGMHQTYDPDDSDLQDHWLGDAYIDSTDYETYSDNATGKIRANISYALTKSSNAQIYMYVTMQEAGTLYEGDEINITVRGWRE